MRPTHTTLIPRVLAAALCLLAAGLAIAACGGGSPSSSSSSGSAGSESSGSAEDSALRFSQCMREHGVKEFPNPETGPGGTTKLTFKQGNVDPQTMEAAQEACQHFRSEGEESLQSPQEKVEGEEVIEKFAACMREHGIELEVSGTGGAVKIQGGTGGGPSPESPAFKEAQEACQGLLPGPAGEGGFKTSAGG